MVANVTALMQTVAAAWMMMDIGSSLQVALIQSAISAPVMLFAYAAGTVADVMDRTRLIVAANMLMMLSAALLAAAAFVGGAKPALMLGLCFGFGCGNALFGPAGMAAVSDYLPRPMMPEGVASLGVAFNLARCIGPALGGACVGLLGAASTFAVSALACGAMVALFLMQPAIQRSPRSTGSILTRFAEGLGFAVADRSTRAVLARVAVFAAAASPIWALLPLVVQAQLGGSSWTYGVLMSAMGFGAIGMSLAFARFRRRLGLERLVQMSWIATAASLAALTQVTSLPAAAIILFLAGGGWVSVLTACNIALQLTAPLMLAGRVIGAFYTAVFGGLAVGSWLWGAVADGAGLTMTLVVAGAATSLFGIAGLRWPMRHQ